MSAFSPIPSALPPRADVMQKANLRRLLTQSGPRASRGLNLEKHPDKTFIGRVEKGFDFLGYHFGPEAPPCVGRTCSGG